MQKRPGSSADRTPIIPVEVTGEALHGPAGWLLLASRRIQCKKNDKIANMALVGAVILMFVQIWSLHHEIENSSLSRQAPLNFQSDWIPDKKTYHAGDLVSFKFTFTTLEPNLLLFTLDGFRNVKTEEVFPAGLVGRLVDGKGIHTMGAVRQIPPYVKPGQYRFEGWMQTQTSKRSLAVSYHSPIFNVVP